jgi:hypothetical protein
MIVKIYAGGNDVAQVTCPECGKTKSIDVSKFKKLDKAVKGAIKCPCGHRCQFLLERRQYYRKPVKLKGILKPLTPEAGTAKRAVEILDISRSGLKISVAMPHHLKPGDLALIEFYLDDKQKSYIHKKVRIKSISGAKVGIAFQTFGTADFCDRAIGFYLLS